MLEHYGVSQSSSALFTEPSSPYSSISTPAKPDSKQEKQFETINALIPLGRERVLPKNVCPQSCKVCGDAASGYHYETPSCNGCKTFFRRAVLEQRKFLCKKNFECKNRMTKDLRVKCRACRFDRCVDAGMNPLGILSETNPGDNPVVREILSKRKLMEQQGAVRPRHAEQPTTISGSIKVVMQPQLLENTMDRLIDELVHLEVAYDRIRKSNHWQERQTLTIGDAIRGRSILDVDFGVAPQRRITAPFTDGPLMKFTPIEVRIRDRIRFEIPADLHARQSGHPKPKVWSYLDLVYAIEYLKTFDFFHELPESDQRILVKNVAVMTVLITNSFYSFECKSDVTIYPDGYIHHGRAMLEWVGDIDARHDIEIHYETVQRVKALNLDKKEYVLIKALVSCNPAIEDLTSTSRTIMQKQRDRYASSLMSYVMARRGFDKGPTICANIMSHVDWLTRLAQRKKDMYALICALGLKHPYMPPLLDDLLG